MPFASMHRPVFLGGFRGAVKWIVIVSGVLLLAQRFVPQLATWLGLIPVLVLREYWLWQLLTYVFLDVGILHWLFNILMIWGFGSQLESRWGTPYFMRFFLACSLGTAACVLLLAPHSSLPSIGASGAVVGLLAAYAMVYPDAVLYMYVLPLRPWQFAALYAFIECFTGYPGSGGLSRYAHLGGMLTGYLYLRSGDRMGRNIFGFARGTADRILGFFHRRGRPVEFHEVTDDLVKEVDRILEKVLREGADSLTPKERAIMSRYSRLKH